VTAIIDLTAGSTVTRQAANFRGGGCHHEPRRRVSCDCSVCEVSHPLTSPRSFTVCLKHPLATCVSTLFSWQPASDFQLGAEGEDEESRHACARAVLDLRDLSKLHRPPHSSRPPPSCTGLSSRKTRRLLRCSTVVLPVMTEGTQIVNYQVSQDGWQVVPAYWHLRPPRRSFWPHHQRKYAALLH